MVYVWTHLFQIRDTQVLKKTSFYHVVTVFINELCFILIYLIFKVYFERDRDSMSGRGVERGGYGESQAGSVLAA